MDVEGIVGDEMPACMIVQQTIGDEIQYLKYLKTVGPLIRKLGSEFINRSSRFPPCTVALSVQPGSKTARKASPKTSA